MCMHNIRGQNLFSKVCFALPQINSGIRSPKFFFFKPVDFYFWGFLGQCEMRARTYVMNWRRVFWRNFLEKLFCFPLNFFFARKSWTSFHLCCFFDVFFWQDVKTWKIRDYFRFLRKISNCTVKVIHIESTKCKKKRYYIICKIEFWVKKIQMLSILHSLNGKMH